MMCEKERPTVTTPVTVATSLPREVPAGQQALEAWVGAQGLFQLCVFRLGFPQDGDVRVGVFPEGKEVLVGHVGLGECVGL